MLQAGLRPQMSQAHFLLACRAMGGSVLFQDALAGRLGVMHPSRDDLERFLAGHPPKVRRATLRCSAATRLHAMDARQRAVPCAHHSTVDSAVHSPLGPLGLFVVSVGRGLAPAGCAFTCDSTHRPLTQQSTDLQSAGAPPARCRLARESRSWWRRSRRRASRCSWCLAGSASSSTPLQRRAERSAAPALCRLRGRPAPPCVFPVPASPSCQEWAPPPCTLPP